MISLKHLTLLTFGVAFTLNLQPVVAATTSAPPSYGPPSSSQLPPIHQRPAETPKPQTPRIPMPPKPVLPPMAKPFGMPGVVGLDNDKWVGTDYLGYLSENIAIDVELLKTNDVPALPDTSVIQQRVAEIFTKHNIKPHAEEVEGPPLPFLHILLIVYPVAQDKFVIFGNARLFEQIKVERKDFVPKGYWQGITWENQDVSLSNAAQLDEKIKLLADKLADAFATRFRQYNLGSSAVPPLDK